MTRKTVVTVLAIASIVIGMGSAAAQEFRIKFAHPAPPSDPAHAAAQYFADKIAERTGGKVRVTIFPSGQLGKEQEIVQGLQSGAIEMCFFSSTHIVNHVPEFGILDLPYLVTKQADVGRLLEGDIGKELMSKLPAARIEGLAYSESSFRNVFTKKRVTTLDDLKGLKLRVPNSPVYVGTVRAMGALPTPIAFGELYSALQQGVVDGAETSGSAYWSYRFYEVGNQWVVTNHTILPGVYLMSQRFWRGLPADIQKIVRETAVEAGLHHRKLAWDNDESGLKNAQEKGAQVHPIADLRPVMEKARALYPEFAKKIGTDLVNRVLAMFPGT